MHTEHQCGSQHKDDQYSQQHQVKYDMFGIGTARLSDREAQPGII